MPTTAFRRFPRFHAPFPGLLNPADAGATPLPTLGAAPWQTNAVLALWLTGAGNVPLWQKVLSVGGSGAWVLWVTMAALVASVNFALLSLITWSRGYRWMASVLVLAAAANTHFMRTYGVVIDPSMMANVLNTDAREATDLLTPALPLTLLLVAGPALWWIWRRPLRRRGVWQRLWRNTGAVSLGLALAVASGVAGYQGLASLMRNHKAVRYMINPLNTVYAVGALAAERVPTSARAIEPVGEDARLGASYAAQARPPLLVLVIGETARAEDFGLNGYHRQTTPVLAQWQRDKGLVNFPDVSACGTNTEVSVPCIFSPLTREQGGNRKPMHENLLDVLQRAGLAVLWLDNQSGCKGVCARVPNVSTRQLSDKRWCPNGECHDEIMLEGLEERLAALDPQRRERGVVLVMHQMGSHGPAYFKRTPADAKPFGPECVSQTLSDCRVEEVRNAYDNTIAYTDRFLGRTLTWLEAQSGQYDTGMIYLSDHGESLGENGLYLHGLPYAVAPEQQVKVPMVAWLSRGMQRRTGVEPRCLQGRASQALSHDHLFHSVLGLMDVETQVHDRRLDIFSWCAPGGML
ncbi:MAG: lipid ethanolaminephosphotransferase [Betaproteobacteria bacterium]|nr:lipid ethanolaminephosphotransferase [Betaproteobacteria bacterium]